MKRIVLLLILLTFCISNASALTYDGLPNPTALCDYPEDDTILFVGDDPDSTGDAIYTFNTDTGSWGLKVVGLPQIDDIDVVDGKINFLTSTDILYKCTATHGIWNFSDSAYDDDFLNLGSFSADHITHTEDGYHYGLDTYLYEKQPPIYTQTQLTTFQNREYGLGVHKDGLLVCTGERDRDHDHGGDNLAEGSVLIYDPSTDSSTEVGYLKQQNENQIYAIFYDAVSDAAGNVYSFGTTKTVWHNTMTWPTSSRYYHHVYNSTTGEYSQNLITSLGLIPNDATISDAVYISYDDTIESLVTVDGLGGYTGDPVPDATGNLSWDVGTGGTYTAGDVANINYSITSMDSSKDYTIQVKTGSGTIKQTYNISSSSGSVSYSFPLDTLPGAYFAGVYEQDTKLDGDHCYLENPNYNYNIGFSKEQYSPGEWVVINYEGLTPEMDLILANDDAFDDSDILQNWTKSGDSQVSYHLSDDYAQDGINLILKLNGEVLQQDYADVVTQDTNLLYGTVYDSSTGSRIENAHVNVGGTVVITDSDGQYNYMTATGTYDVTVSKDGYLPVNQYVVIEGQTKRDFFLTPETGSSDIYGTVRDQDTGDPIPQATIFVSGPSYGASTFTSGTGYFSLDGLTPDEEYSISATASGYESYISTFTATNNSTDLSFSMYPTGTGGSGTGEPTIEDHREAARKTLYETYGVVPSLFTLVIFFLIFQIITRGMK